MANATIGDYQLQDKLGEGGMGAVFKARQISLDRVVALKILPQRLAKNKDFIERFMREARATAKLNHPNIISGIDVGFAAGYYYFAMEYVNGETLKGCIDRKKVLPEAEVMRIGIATAEALTHAHSHQLIHRDVKPGDRPPTVRRRHFRRADGQSHDGENAASAIDQSQIERRFLCGAGKNGGAQPRRSLRQIGSCVQDFQAIESGLPIKSPLPPMQVNFLPHKTAHRGHATGEQIPAGIAAKNRAIRQAAPVHREESVESHRATPARRGQPMWLWASGGVAVALAVIAFMFFGGKNNLGEKAIVQEKSAEKVPVAPEPPKSPPLPVPAPPAPLPAPTFASGCQQARQRCRMEATVRRQIDQRHP